MSENNGADTSNGQGAPENEPVHEADVNQPETPAQAVPESAAPEVLDPNATARIEQPPAAPAAPMAETQPLTPWQSPAAPSYQAQEPAYQAPEQAYQAPEQAAGQAPGYPSVPPAPADPAMGPATPGDTPTAQGYPAPHMYQSTLAPAVTAQKKPRKKVGMGMFALSVVAAAVIGAGAAGGTYALINGNQGSSLASSNQQVTPLVVNNPNSVNQTSAAAAKAMPSVVTISATSGTSGGTGSGIILDTAGHILTNTHVVTLDGQAAHATIQVQLSNGKVYAATVVGTDPLSDLAVVKIDAPNLVPATLGDSNKINVGDSVIAIGSPLGLNATVTEGIISTLNRTIQVASSAVPSTPSDTSPDQGNGGNGFQFSPPGGGQSSTAGTGTVNLNVIQTDAAINPGNSGGALVNSQGQVIGVNVAIASTGSSSSSSSQSGNIGVGFSIPIDHAKQVAQEIIATGTATHGQLGVSVSATPALGANSQFTDGATVASVTSGSAAAKAGLKQGDVIVQLGNRTISDASSLTAAVREQTGGAKVQLTYIRGGKTQNVDVTLDTMPAG